MNAVAKVKGIKEKVHQLLTEKEDYRDNDLRLVCRVWWDELKALGFNAKEVDSLTFFNQYLEGRITSADSITRSSRLIQMNHPELRGKGWEERQKHSKEFAKEINE